MTLKYRVRYTDRLCVTLSKADIMNGKVLVCNPSALPNELPRRRIALDSLAGKVVGFIDNAKPNFNYLVDELADQLVNQHGVGRIIKHRKRGAAMPATTEIVSDIAEQCDAVITGSGD